MIDTDLEVRLAPKPLLAEVLECFQDPAAVLRRHSWTATAYYLALLYPSRGFLHFFSWYLFSLKLVWLIFAFYFTTVDQPWQVWEEKGKLPNLGHPAPQRLSMGIHLIGGIMILLVGPFQLINKIRNEYPEVHRAGGYIYLMGCVLAATGGEAFILINGTAGGVNMDIAFALYGVLLFFSAVRTWTTIQARDFVAHREWAIRLFSLGLGALLYRMYYSLLASFIQYPLPTAGSAMDAVALFQRPLDKVLVWLFFLPNLLIAQYMIWLTKDSSATKELEQPVPTWKAYFCTFS